MNRGLKCKQECADSHDGLQGCLGWDKAKERVQGSYAATVTSDKWLVLAARTQHVLSGLRRCQDLATAEVIPPIAAFLGDQKRELPRRGYLANSIAEALDTLQGTLLLFVATLGRLGWGAQSVHLKHCRLSCGREWALLYYL
jgi:hypothetical protein